LFLVAYALGEDAGSGSGAVQLGGLPMSGQFSDLLGRVIGDAGQAYGEANKLIHAAHLHPMLCHRE